MPDATLADRLLASPAFQAALRAVTLISVRAQFRMLEPTLDFASDHPDLTYLLECANVLAKSSHGDCQDAALRVAHYALTTPNAAHGHRIAAALALDALANHPGLTLAITRSLIEPGFLEGIPGPLLLDALRREVEFSVLDPNSGTLTRLNRFQMEAARSMDVADWVSLSSPTSSGKSFVLQLAVRSALTTGTRSVVYIVPTRALIQEVEVTLKASLEGLASPPTVSSVPQLPRSVGAVPTIFVFTQERLQVLYSEEKSFVPELVIVDEAQKIGEGARGILLESVLDETVRRRSNVRVVFASPMSDNPSHLLEQAPRGATSVSILSEQVSVNQNLLWASQVSRKPRLWALDLCLGDETIRLGELSLPKTPAPSSKRLPFVAAALGEAGGNLVYVTGPADAEDVAILLSDYFREQRGEDSDLANLVELASKTVHRDYALTTTVPSGVAFHYGNMPLILRSEIERLFRIGKLRFLVCTSTLMEGVNLPARSIFVRGSLKGAKTPMSAVDFWNLAGRAGRQGKEFQGNIVCVDPRTPSVWHTPPPRTRQRYTIERNTARVLTKRTAALVAYVEAGTPRSARESDDELESTFVYLLKEHSRVGGLRQSARLVSLLDPVLLERLDTLCDKTFASIDLPQDLLSRNPGVSPLAQQRLLEYFRSRSNIEDALPVDPASEDAREHYIRVIGITSEYLSGDPIRLNHPRAILVVNWMRGYPLARLIADAWSYWQDRGLKLATVIRRTMAEIEEYVRFRFAKYSACYVDVLRFHLGQVDRQDLLSAIPKLNMWLEFGTSIVTQLSLITLGLSRTSAIEISRLIADDDLDVDVVLQRLKEMNLEGSNLSPVIVAEVARVLRGRATA